MDDRSEFKARLPLLQMIDPFVAAAIREARKKTAP